MRARGLSASSIHNTLDPLRVIFRRAIRADLVAADPTKTVELASSRNAASALPSRPRCGVCWPPCRPPSARCGRWPPTGACAAGSCAPCAAQTLTSTPAASA
jgi:hypothetical protein